MQYTNTYYEDIYNEEASDKLQQLLERIYISGLQNKVNPVILALWYEHMMQSASNAQFTVTKENLEQFNVEQLSQDWRFAYRKLSVSSNLFTRITASNLIGTIRKQSLVAEEAALLYASYQQLHPDLVEVMFMQAQWLDISYQELLLAEQKENTLILQDEYISSGVLQQVYTNSGGWIGCSNQEALVCIPDDLEPLASQDVQDVQEIQDSQASASAQVRSSPDVVANANNEVIQQQILLCYKSTAFTELCENSIFIDW